MSPQEEEKRPRGRTAARGRRLELALREDKKTFDGGRIFVRGGGSCSRMGYSEAVRLRCEKFDWTLGINVFTVRLLC